MHILDENYDYDPYNFNFISREFSVEGIIRLFNHKKLNIDEYEWSTRQCSLFIESILIIIPLEPFYLDRTKEEYKIISGHKRLSALKLIILDSCKLQGLEILTDLNNLTFQQLSRKYQRRILETCFLFHIIEAGTPQFIVDNISKRIS